MTLHWFRPDAPQEPTSVDRYREQLEPFGVVLKDPVGRATYFVDEESGDFLMEIGSLVYWPALGRLNAFPRLELQERQTLSLLGSASRALREDRFCRASNWELRRSKGQTRWRADIVVPLREDDEPHRLIARSRRGVDLEVELQVGAAECGAGGGTRI